MFLNRIKSSLAFIYKPKKSKEYDAYPVSERDFYKIARLRKEEIDKIAEWKYFIRLNYDYTYERKGNLINVRPVNARGGHDTSANIELCLVNDGRNILKVTYYKPTMMNNSAIAFLSIILIIYLSTGKLFWIGIPFMLAFFPLNYFSFLSGWSNVESDIVKTFNLVKS